MKKILYLLWFAPVMAIGQGSTAISPGEMPWLAQNAHCSFPAQSLSGTTPTELLASAQAWLKANLPDLKNENTGLLLTQNIASPYARYFTFAQTFLGTQIYGTSIKIGVDKQNKILNLVSKTCPVDNWPVNVSISNPDTNALKAAIGSFDHYSWQKTWFYDPAQPIAAFDVTCYKNDGSRDDELVLDANSNILYSHSLSEHYKYPDSLATLYAFYPDPLTSARVPYAEPYTNHNDSDVAVLDSQMFPMQVRVSVLNNDSFVLENEFVQEVDMGPPYAPYDPEPSWSKTPVFHFHRDTSAFRDVNVFFNINSYRAHMKAIGYDSLGHQQIQVDPSGETDDNSTFVPQGTQLKIYFGIGGIPDAEDADVSWHEYTHFISYCACKACSNGFERQALDEGSADYIAASNSKAISTYNWTKVYNWDGNVPGWYGRSVDIPDTYLEGMNKFQEIHLDGQLWSSSLMQIWDAIGRAKTDGLMYETFYSLGPNLTMPDAAKLYIKADSLIYKGVDVPVIAHYFIQRQFLPASYLGVNTAVQPHQTGYKIITSYFETQNKVIFEFDEPQSGTMTLYDVTGKKLADQELNHAGNVEFNAPPLAQGIYVLRVATGGLQKSFKLMK